MFSFVKDGVVYQVMRLEAGALKRRRRNSDKDSIDGHVNADDASFSAHSSRSGATAQHEAPAEPVPDRHIKVRVGGTVRIGCKCQKHFDQKPTAYDVRSLEHTDHHVLMCNSPMYHKSLHTQLFVDGQKISMPRSPPHLPPAPLPPPLLPPAAIWPSPPPSPPPPMGPLKPELDQLRAKSEDQPNDLSKLTPEVPPFPPSASHSLEMSLPPLNIPLPPSTSIRPQSYSLLKHLNLELLPIEGLISY